MAAAGAVQSSWKLGVFLDAFAGFYAWFEDAFGDCHAVHDTQVGAEHAAHAAREDACFYP